MKVVLTKHAEKQLKNKNVSLEMVHKTIANPDQVIPQEDNILLYQSIYHENGKQYLLRVAVKPHAGIWLILTAYRTSKAQKYWGDNL